MRTDEDRRKRAAERQRRYRQRDRRDQIVLSVLVDASFVSWCLDTGRTSERTAFDRKMLATIVRRIIEEVMAASKIAVTRNAAIPRVTSNLATDWKELDDVYENKESDAS